MSALFIFKELVSAKHVDIISPYYSMQDLGPQATSGDAVCFQANPFSEKVFDNIKMNSHGIGACAVWSELYNIYARSYHMRFNSTYGLIDFLRDNKFVGVETPLKLLGSFMFNKTVDTVVRDILSIMYDRIPGESSLACLLPVEGEEEKKCNTKYHADILIAYDNITAKWVKSKTLDRKDLSTFLELYVNNDPKKLISPQQWEGFLSSSVKEREGRGRFEEITLVNMMFVLVTCKHRDAFFIQ